MTDSSLMQAFFDGTNANFYIKDAEGRFLLVNKKSAQSLHLREAGCPGKTANDLIPKVEADRTIRINRQVPESGEPAMFRDQVTRPGGERAILDLELRVSIPGHPGGIAVDITGVA